LGGHFPFWQELCQTSEKNRRRGEFSFSEPFSPAVAVLYQPDEAVCIVDMTVYTPDEAFDTLDEPFFNADLVVFTLDMTVYTSDMRLYGLDMVVDAPDLRLFIGKTPFGALETMILTFHKVL
jgi:hypothetical protein